jgi:hypothetical protein
MPFPTDGYSPDQATYLMSFSNDDFQSASAQVAAPAWSQFPGWQDALEAAVIAFRDSILASLGEGVAAQVDRSVTAVVSTPVEAGA